MIIKKTQDANLIKGVDKAYTAHFSTELGQLSRCVDASNFMY